MLYRRRYYAVGHHKAGLRPLCTDLYGPPAPQTAHHSNIVSCSRSHCAPGAFLHFGTPLPRCRGPPFSRFASPPNLENGGQKMSYHNDPYRVDYLKIYPCLKERPDVLEVLKKSDRKMKYIHRMTIHNRKIRILQKLKRC